MKILGEAGDGHKRGGIDRKAGILQADERDEKSDAHGNAALERERNGIENRLADVGQGHGDEDKALDENGQQRNLPAVAIAEDDGIGQIGVQAHAGGEHERQIRQHRHADGADEGSDGRRQEHSGRVHARGAEDARIDREDIGHRHKRRDAGHDLGLHVGFVCGELKDSFEHSSSFLSSADHYWGSCVFLPGFINLFCHQKKYCIKTASIFYLMLRVFHSPFCIFYKEIFISRRSRKFSFI